MGNEHATSSQDVESLRTFTYLHAANTRKLEQRVADLEARLGKEIDERESSMLNQALLMKKITRLEARCSELESLNRLRISPRPEQAGAFELRFEQLQKQTDASLSDHQPVELERRLEGFSRAAEKALEETKRISTELRDAASSFALVDKQIGVQGPSSTSVPAETARAI